MTKAFCFGNGNSRKGLNLDYFKKYGTVIGCNAVYRDFTPDIVVGLDSRIGHEIYRSGYAHKHKTYFRDWYRKKHVGIYVINIIGILFLVLPIIIIIIYIIVVYVLKQIIIIVKKFVMKIKN